MTSKERLLAAIERKVPDRLPVTTHHVMAYFLKTYMKGMSNGEFFNHFGLDSILWIVPHKPDPSKGEYYVSTQEEVRVGESQRILSDNWRIESEELQNPEYKTIRYTFITPKGRLTMVTQSNEYTTWISEYLIKEKRDIDIIGEYVTTPKCDVEAVNKEAAEADCVSHLRWHDAHFRRHRRYAAGCDGNLHSSWHGG